MNTKTSFEDFLKRKSNEQGILSAFHESLKKEWIEAVYGLYQQIENWLRPFENEKLLQISRDKIITINEEEIGSYQIQQLDIRIGTETIHLIPVARIVIGAIGRIDMKSEKGDIKILRPTKKEWKFVQKNLKLDMWEVNEESFITELQILAS